MTSKAAESALQISLSRIEKKLDRIADILEQFGKFVLEVTPDAAIADTVKLQKELESIE
jgi:hypothetical protein